MELKSPDKNIRIVGLAGIVAGLGMIVAGHASFGTTLLGGGLLFLALPLFRTAGKKKVFSVRCSLPVVIFWRA